MKYICDFCHRVYDDEPLSAPFTYGADADGNRGERVCEIECPHCGYDSFTKFDDETDEGELVITLSEEIEKLEMQIEKLQRKLEKYENG